MGRKMKATKSGKFINPTDQARKEARKRELRKNKKQRLIVRTAVLKGKDPFQIITDLERLDKMEYDIENVSLLNEKVLKDKRRKLKETWDRLVRLYVKDDRDRFLELKRIEAEYEMKRAELVKQFEAVKSAQEVNIDEIPLPSMPMGAEPGTSTESTNNSKVKSILRSKVPPGCPQGPPPLLTEFDMDDSESEDEEDLASPSRKKIRFSDDAKEKDSNLKEFLEEIEQLSGEKNVDEKEKSSDDGSGVVASVPGVAAAASTSSPLPVNQAPVLQPAPPVVLGPNVNVPTQHLSLPMRPNMALGPPRMPPPPPLAALPRLPMQPMPGSTSQPTRLPMPQVPLSAAQPSASYGGYPRKHEERRPHVTTIEAKPQLRNLSADATKFMPLALRIKRDEKQTPNYLNKKTAKPIVNYGMVGGSSYGSTAKPAQEPQTKSKDEAYDSFMKEMSGLL